MQTALCIRFAPFFTIQHATRGDIRGPFSRLDKPSAETSEPSYSSRSITTSVLKRLALDVAAVLASTTGASKSIAEKTFFAGNLQAKAPRKNNISQTERRTGDVVVDHRRRRLSGSSIDPVSVPERMMMGSPVASALADAQNTLRNAVRKAVSGTPEEVYWLGVSRIRV